MESALSGSYHFEEFAPEQIGQILACLAPHNCLVTHVSHRHAAAATLWEPWCGAA